MPEEDGNQISGEYKSEMGPRQLMLINEVSLTSTNRKDQWRNSAEVRKRTYFVPSKVRPRDYQTYHSNRWQIQVAKPLGLPTLCKDLTSPPPKRMVAARHWNVMIQLSKLIAKSLKLEKEIGEALDISDIFLL